VLIGLVNVHEQSSHGALQADRVREIRRLATDDGFDVVLTEAGKAALTLA
jgi:hypothetical protein